MTDPRRDVKLLALDLGTSSLKGAVYDEQGTLLAEASREYTLYRPAPMWVEQDPAEWWEAAVAVCRRLLSAVHAEAISAVGLSGQVPTMLLVDAAGEPRCNAITWQDRRADVEANWLRTHLGPDKLAQWLGIDLPVDAGWPPARLLWWRRHEPQLLQKAHKVLVGKDFLLLRLTGEFCSDAWSAKGIAHLLTGEAPPEFYSALEVPASIAPRTAPPWAIVGRVHKEAAQATGLLAGTPVVTGWSDALCGMAGTGALEGPGRVFNITGTSEIIGYSGGEPRPGLMYVPEAITSSTSVVYGPTQGGGDSLSWFAEWSNSDVVSTVEAAGSAPAGAGGTLFLPYLQGERAPIWDSTARGAFVGMRRGYGPGYGARAVLEGVAMSVRHVLEACGAPLTASEVLRVSGGNTRLELWNQIRADVTGTVVETGEQSNATLLGAAMLASIGTGVYPDLKSAAAMVRVRKRYPPDQRTTAVYAALYEQYRALYPLLKPVFARLAEIEPGRSG